MDLDIDQSYRPGKERKPMSAPSRGPQEWSTIITETYAAGSKPPLTGGLMQRLHAAILDACIRVDSLAAFTHEDVAAINGVLDQFEVDLDAVSGPRLFAIDPASGAVEMAHRSEAGHPLRAFGGQ
ncbi:hypothetical protein [Methylobacterium iners]|nr:hypothetical protein [Methylobacterium iners]